MMRVKCRPIELALALCMAFLFAYMAWVSLSQQTLTDGLLRLHVIANSDSVQDQQVKLLVRDRVLELTEPLLAEADAQDEVRRISAHIYSRSPMLPSRYSPIRVCPISCPHRWRPNTTRHANTILFRCLPVSTPDSKFGWVQPAVTTGGVSSSHRCAPMPRRHRRTSSASRRRSGLRQLTSSVRRRHGCVGCEIKSR